MATRKEILVPDIGDFSNVDVIEVLVAPGDRVQIEQGLITIETDKATMDVPSPLAGTLIEVRVNPGDKVSRGSVLALIELEDGVAGSGDPVKATVNPAPAPEIPLETPAVHSPIEPSAGSEPAAPLPQAPAAGTVQVSVPDIGDFSAVDVIEVLVSAGDSVAAEQGLITIETDKATMDIPAPRAGIVASLQVKAGDKVSRGDPILTLSVSEPTAVLANKLAAAPAETGDSTSTVARVAATPAPSGGADEVGFALAHAGPAVRKFAREVGVDLIRVKGTGRRGRITRDDVKQYLKARMSETSAAGTPGLPAVPKVDFARFGPIELRPLGRIRKISGPRLQASWLNIPHVTQHDDADITDMEAMRKALTQSAASRGIRLTPLAFIMRACAMALQEFPQFNSSLDSSGENLVFKQYLHIGFAADTENGLVVPVVRDADKKDVFELARELAELSAAAREGKLSAAQIQGGCFTVSSLGGIGGTGFTPIINAPEVAILGVSRSRMAPVYDGEAFLPRLMLPLSLSYDYRVIDGADAARFTAYLATALGNVPKLIQAIP
ncbi:MAG: dihydrolipoyllysine-residue acetyltransferase [Gammaproteobacteria bacterium]|nr:dihydrolipoyllysine-residue acetyltransferase [Gammaproteobacteria bacterium]